MPDSIDHFDLERSSDISLEQNWAFIATNIPPETRAWTDTTTPNPEFWYRLTGKTKNGVTIPYNVVSIRRQTTPGAFAWQQFIRQQTAFKNIIVNGIDVDASGVVAVGYFFGSADFGDGVIYTSAGERDIFVAKYTNGTSPTLQWVKTFGGALLDQATAVAIDSSGNIAVVGMIGSAVDFGSGAVPFLGNTDIFVLKLSSVGATLWAHSYGETAGDAATSVCVDSTGKIYVAGYVGFGPVNFGAAGILTGKGSQNGFILKIDSDSLGTSLWAKRFVCGGFGDANVIKGICINSQNKVVVGGFYTGTIDTGGSTIPTATNGAGCLFLTSVSNDGATHNWDMFPDSTGFNAMYGVAPDPSNSNGDVVITGPISGTANFGSISITTNGGTGIFVGKVNNLGVAQWVKPYGGDPSSTDQGVSVSVDNSGSIYVTGTAQSVLAFGGNFYYGNGGANFFAFKLLSDKTEVWIKRILPAAGAIIKASRIAQEVFIGGDTSGPVDFGGGNVTFQVPGREGFLVKYST